MGRHGCRDHDRLDPVVGQHLHVRRRPLDRRVAPAPVLEPLLALVAHRHDLGVVELDEVAKEVRAPVAEADDRDAERLAHRVAFGLTIWTGVFSSSAMSPQNDQLRA